MRWLDHGVAAPAGFRTGAVAAGIKESGLDLAVITSDQPCEYAGVFTRNVVKAAPVIWNMHRLEQKSQIQAVVVNSGNANACTGAAGEACCNETASHLAKSLDVDNNQILLASTGVIGVPLSADRIKVGIDRILLNLGEDKAYADLSSEAIRTTDTYSKQCAVSFEIEDTVITIGGMAKGSGMIHPNMGTMLAFITTDAVISRMLLQKLLKECVDDTYNMISVDGDTSTNDMVTILANGKSGCVPIEEGSQAYRQFRKAFFEVNEYLAKEIAADGEGATKLIEVQVKGLKETLDAKKMVHALISSNLVKTAFYGEDPNWGRVLCAMGYSEAQFDPSKVNLTFRTDKKSVQLMHQGEPQNFDEAEVAELLAEKRIVVAADCNNGDASARGWGCDLSHQYITINGSYRT